MISTNPSGQTFPGLTLKAWAQVTVAGVLVKAYNVASITKGAAGIYTANFSANLATTTYLLKVQSVAAVVSTFAIGTRLVGSAVYVTRDSVGANTDMDNYVEFWE